MYNMIIDLKRVFSSRKWFILLGIFLGFFLYSSITYFDLWNPDSMIRGIYAEDVIWVQQMRWANQLWEEYGRSFFVLPELTLMVAISLLSLSAALICDIFDVHKKTYCVLITVLVVSSIHQISTMTYAYCGDEFTIAYFFAVFAAWTLAKTWDEGNGRYYLISCVISVVGLAIYQSYFSITLILIFIKGLLVVVEEDFSIKVIKKIIIQGCNLCAAIVLYVASVFVSLKLYNTSLSQYRNMDQFDKIGVEKVVDRIVAAYKYFYLNYFTEEMYNGYFRGKIVLNYLCLFCIFISLILMLKCHRTTAKKIILVVGMVVLFPMAFNFTYLLTDTDTGVSFMMLPNTPYLYIAAIVMILKSGYQRRTVFEYLGVTIIAIIAWSSVITNMVTLQEIKIDIEKTRNIANNLDYLIKSQENYEIDTKVIVVGNIEKGMYPDINDNLYNKVSRGTVHDFDQFWYGDGLVVWNGWYHIFQRYCGSQYNWITYDEYNSITSSTEFKEMGIYPKNNCVKFFEDILVVKVSDL